MLDLSAIGLEVPFVRRLVTVGVVREPGSIPGHHVRSARDVFQEFKGLAALDREAFVALHLDQKNHVTGVHLVSVGSLSASLVHPREVFKAAIVTNAAGILVLHNHPSGEAAPSREDHEITGRLKQSGEILGIPLMDHVIIGAERFYSFSEAGAL